MIRHTTRTWKVNDSTLDSTQTWKVNDSTLYSDLEGQ